MGHRESNPKREIHSITSLSPKIKNKKKKPRKSSTEQSNFTFKELEKEQQIKPKVSRMKEIIKIRAEINEIQQVILKDKKDQ